MLFPKANKFCIPILSCSPGLQTMRIQTMMISSKQASKMKLVCLSLHFICKQNLSFKVSVLTHIDTNLWRNQFSFLSYQMLTTCLQQKTDAWQTWGSFNSRKNHIHLWHRAKWTLETRIVGTRVSGSLYLHNWELLSYIESIVTMSVIKHWPSLPHPIVLGCSSHARLCLTFLSSSMWVGATCYNLFQP